MFFTAFKYAALLMTLMYRTAGKFGGEKVWQKPFIFFHNKSSRVTHLVLNSIHISVKALFLFTATVALLCIIIPKLVGLLSV